MDNDIKTIVLGIGNVLLGDEGIGVKVIKELEKEDLPGHVKLIDGATAGFGLLPILEKYKNCKVLIIDAIRINNNRNQNPKGDFYIAPLDKVFEDNKKNIEFISFHQTGILDVLNLLQLSSKIKINGYLFGINIYNSNKDDIVRFSMDLSKEIKDKIPEIIKNLKKYF